MSPGFLSVFLAGALSTMPPPSTAPDASRTLSSVAAARATLEGAKPPTFSASLFEFKPVIRDDNRDDGAGWQEASATLRFFDWRSTLPSIWTCSIKVGVPIRSSTRGFISASDAADMTATIATEASRTVMKSQEEWPVATLYCIKFIREMLRIWKDDPRFKGTGARVN